MEQGVPKAHQRTQAERKRQLCGGWPRGHCRLRHQMRIQGDHVFVADLGKGRVGKRRVQGVALARHALAHGALEGAERPAANACLAVGREVGGVDRAKGRVHGASTGVALTAFGGVAACAVAQGGHLLAARHHAGVEGTGVELRHPRQAAAPAQQGRTHGKDAQPQRGQLSRSQPPTPCLSGLAAAWFAPRPA